MGKHTKTWEAIFTTPTRASVRWSDAKSMLVAVGAEVEEREGSRVSITLEGILQVIHAPHPGNELKKYQVEALRDLLDASGVDAP